MYGKIHKPDVTQNPNDPLSKGFRLDFLSSQLAIPKVNLGNPVNNSPVPLLSMEDLLQISQKFDTFDNIRTNAAPGSKEDREVVPDKLPDDWDKKSYADIVDKVKDILDGAENVLSQRQDESVINEVLDRSQFNTHTFDPNWYDEYLKKVIPPGRQHSRNPQYARLIELKDYLNKKNPYHPNPANILDFFMWAKGKLNSIGIYGQVNVFNHFFTWVSQKKDNDDRILYPNIMGKIHMKNNIDSIMNRLRRECNLQRMYNVDVPHPTLDYFIKFLQEQEQSNSTSVVTFRTFVEYLECLFNLNEKNT